MAGAPAPVRPALALRVGVTGTRNLDPAQVSQIEEKLRDVLFAVRQIMSDLAERGERVASAYQHHPNSPPRPLLRFLSPLARGADRLAARQALALGYQLHVPMPFPQEEYECDFMTPEDLAEFRDLLARAGDDRLALDGDHGPEKDRAYEAVGRYVVRNCDLLIAVWDGLPSAGRGGTADIVRFAASAGAPVWWINAVKERPPGWIDDIAGLRDAVDLRDATDLRDSRLKPPPAEVRLQRYLEGQIPPPAPAPRHADSIVESMALVLLRGEVSPEARYFAEREGKPRWAWKAYGTLIRWTSGLKPARLSEQGAQPPDDPVARYWFDRYGPVDVRAGDYAARYRSSYVWVFVLATLALIFGATALLLSLLRPTEESLRMLSLLRPTEESLRRALETGAALFAFAELAALLLILALIWFGIRREWHKRFIEYRLLAELCRKQQALAPLGWALPIIAVRGVVAAPEAKAEVGPPGREYRKATGGDSSPEGSRTGDPMHWLAWLFAAEQRAAPLPRGELAHAARGAPRTAVLQELIAEQQRYHADRGQRAERAGHTLARWGERVFFIVLVCVLLKLVFAHIVERPSLAVAFAFLATILFGVSAAVVGIRAYAELQLLAEQSRHMAAELNRAHERVKRLKPNRVLASQDIGAEAAQVAALMLQDLDGWARLFRVKAMEPG